jgi:hypothetical protein
MKTQLRIWHNSNLGNPHFERDVPDVETAKQWLCLLADYDLYQGDRVTANAQGLMVYNEKTKEWDEWERDEDGEDISAVMREDEEQDEERGIPVPRGFQPHFTRGAKAVIGHRQRKKR